MPDCTPLHRCCLQAAESGQWDVLDLLLATPSGAKVVGTPGGPRQFSPLHLAAGHGRLAAARCLVAANPSAGALRDAQGDTPVCLALKQRCLSVARLLLRRADVPPSDTAKTLRLIAAAGSEAHPLYALLAARVPLSPQQWRSLPAGCPGLEAALPAVLARSAAEVRCLAARLPAATRATLRAGALALARVQRVAGVELPPPLATRMLLEAMAPPPSSNESEESEEEEEDEEEEEEEEEGSYDEEGGGGGGISLEQLMQLMGMGGGGGMPWMLPY